MSFAEGADGLDQSAVNVFSLSLSRHKSRDWMIFAWFAFGIFAS